MNLNITSILSRMATGRDEEIDKLLAQLSEGKKSAGNPLAIRFKPAVREFVTLISGRLGISSAELVNLLVEGIMRETLLPRQACVTRIPERFWLLMDEHKLSSTQVARLLSDWNIGLAVLESREQTMDCLTPGILKKLSEWFYVNPDWLEGTSSSPVHLTVLNDWFHVAQILIKRIRESDPVDILGRPVDILARPEIFLVREIDMQGHKLEDTFIFIRRFRTINNTLVQIVECIGHCLETSESKQQLTGFMSMCGLLLKERIISKTDSYLTTSQILNSLKTGSVLPVSALGQTQKLFLNDEQNYWGSMERNPLLSPSKLIENEWRKIIEDITPAKPE